MDDHPTFVLALVVAFALAVAFSAIGFVLYVLATLKGPVG